MADEREHGLYNEIVSLFNNPSGTRRGAPIFFPCSKRAGGWAGLKKFTDQNPKERYNCAVPNVTMNLPKSPQTVTASVWQSNPAQGALMET